MSTPYRRTKGEPCVRFKSRTKKFEKDIGVMTYVTDVGMWPLAANDDPFDGVPIRVFGHDYRESYFHDGDDFRPLHGTDIRKLEEKYPEYIVRTNEVEG